MKDLNTDDLVSIVVFAVFLVAIIATMIFGIKEEPRDSSYSIEKGTGYCAVCGEPLVKGVYGAHSPHFVWYCPKCP